MSTPYQVRDKLLKFLNEYGCDSEERKTLFSLLGDLAVFYSTRDIVLTRRIIDLRYYLVNELEPGSGLTTISNTILTLAWNDQIRYWFNTVMEPLSQEI